MKIYGEAKIKEFLSKGLSFLGQNKILEKN
jgi:hypothetical protein